MTEKDTVPKATRTLGQRTRSGEPSEEDLERLEGGTAASASDPEFKYVPIRRYLDRS